MAPRLSGAWTLELEGEEKSSLPSHHLRPQGCIPESTCEVGVGKKRTIPTNFVPYWSQLLSREVQLGVADEIIARTREEAAAIEAGNGRGA